jgi:hypothetical protein
VTYFVLAPAPATDEKARAVRDDEIVYTIPDLQRHDGIVQPGSSDREIALVGA